MGAAFSAAIVYWNGRWIAWNNQNRMESNGLRWNWQSTYRPRQDIDNEIVKYINRGESVSIDVVVFVANAIQFSKSLSVSLFTDPNASYAAICRFSSQVND